MPDEDVALDFAARFLPDCFEEVKACGGESVNETVSAEAMSILSSFRQNCHPQENGMHTWEASALLDLLRKTEREKGSYTRPRLKPEVAVAIERQCKDLQWLRDSFGVTFTTLYPEVTNLPHMELDGVESVCEVNPAKREQLLMLVLKQILSDQERSSYRRLAYPLRRWLEFNSPQIYYKMVEFCRRSLTNHR
jgi:hypothetical protein